MANSTLSNAKAAKKDEFYTMFYDIETEMEAYLDYNPNVFRGKTVLLPCDDPEWSNFTKYFAQNFEDLGLKKLISTSYAPESMTYKNGIQLSLFETQSAKYDKDKTKHMERYLFLLKIPQEIECPILMICSGIILRGMVISEAKRSKNLEMKQILL